MNLFQGRRLIIATKHKKEQIIKPVFENQLGVKCFVPQYFDTDLLGTFTGEIERAEDPLSTVRKKCLMAMDKYKIDLGIASEGSFGPHPNFFFLNADIEILILIDRKNNLEIISTEISTDTNFNGKEIHTERDLNDFAEKVLFPSHGIIIRNKKDSVEDIKKDILDWYELKITFNDFLEKFGSVYVETDMRAMNNPSRMRVISKALEQLIEKLNSKCPNCDYPGFEIEERRSGLPCELCNLPTNSILTNIFKCKNCQFILEKKHPKDKFYEDPMYCNFCNP